MKNSYKKLIAFDIYLFVSLIINGFFINYLNNYNMVLFLIFSIILFNYFFVLEENRYRFNKEIIIDMTVNLLIFFIIYYLFGIVIGFYKIDNYYNSNGLFNFILPIFLIVIFREYLRFQVLNKNDNKLLLITTTITFILLDISNLIYFSDLKSIQNIFILIALNVLPSITSNIFLSYISKKTSYIPCIYYSVIMNLYLYLLPMIPNSSNYLISLINFLFPIIMLVNTRRLINKNMDSVVMSRSSNAGVISSIVTVTIILVLVYFNSGYFSHMSIAVASESMFPIIKKGDVVIVKKKIDDFNVGDVIAYKYSGVIIVHRINNLEFRDDKYYYYTKGDANSLEDQFVVTRDMILGRVDFKIPYLGIPTIWLRDI